MKLKVLHISTYLSKGGAARATSRLNFAINNLKGVESSIYSSNIENIKFPSSLLKLSKKFAFRMKNFASSKIQNLQKTKNNSYHSSSLIPSNHHKFINKSDCDIVNLHWVQDEFLSIESIAKIEKPIIWTLHDSWPFCGGEHHPNGLNDYRYKFGYKKNNRDKYHKGFDLDRWVWERKKKNWNQDFTFVSPSFWLAESAKSSALFRNYDVKVIPNPIETDIFKPKNKEICRKILNLPQNKKIIVFGSFTGPSDKNKGWHLVEDTINNLLRENNSIVFVLFGNNFENFANKYKSRVCNLGYIKSNKKLSDIYSACDAILVTSMIENFPQVASEALSCGLPAIGFNSTGIKEAITDKYNGYIFKEYNYKSVIKGINWVITNKERWHYLSNNARLFAIKNWSENIVAKKYLDLYKKKLLQNY